MYDDGMCEKWITFPHHAVSQVIRFFGHLSHSIGENFLKSMSELHSFPHFPDVVDKMVLINRVGEWGVQNCLKIC